MTLVVGWTDLTLPIRLTEDGIDPTWRTIATTIKAPSVRKNALRVISMRQFMNRGAVEDGFVDEAGVRRMKGSEAHKASVTGETPIVSRAVV